MEGGPWTIVHGIDHQVWPTESGPRTIVHHQVWLTESGPWTIVHGVDPRV